MFYHIVYPQHGMAQEDQQGNKTLDLRNPLSSQKRGLCSGKSPSFRFPFNITNRIAEPVTISIYHRSCTNLLAIHANGSSAHQSAFTVTKRNPSINRNDQLAAGFYLQRNVSSICRRFSAEQAKKVSENDLEPVQIESRNCEVVLPHDY